MICDCHVHLPSPGLHRTWEWQPFTPDLPAAVSYLRRCGVDRAVANSMRGEVARTPEDMRLANDESAEAAREYGGFIVPACLVNTNFGRDAAAEVRRCHDELGMVWVGELCGYAGGYTYDTEGFAEAVATAADLNMVVQIHVDDTPDMDRLCREFPSVTWVLPHPGDSAAEVVERCELAAKHAKLYLDLSGHGVQRMGVLDLAVRRAGPDRVLFGSDYTI
ncbi:MAG: amidohydrolase family protein, partial [Armatimonadetes bacterium]|nr:amidohydrolase family protein [Armatimonadota bacterium]